jgi:hypothetical protein
VATDASTHGGPPSGSPVPPSGLDEHDLGAEHRSFARHLAGVEPSALQIAKYVDFHRLQALAPRNAFDARLYRLSRAGSFGLVLADAYTGTLYRKSLVRAKLVLSVAILESAAPSFVALDRPDPGGRWVFVSMAFRVGLSALALVTAALLLAPFHVVHALTAGEKRR